MRQEFPARRVHIFGASGAGTSTIGRELARRHGFAFFDADDFFWQQTDPPYQKAHDREVRRQLLREAVRESDRWVLSGSMCSWGDDVVPMLDLAVFVTTPTPLRLQRLRDREEHRFGERLSPGGDMHEHHLAFMEWASQYDDGPVDMRSRRFHERWIAGLSCRLVRVDGARPVDELCDHLVERRAMITLEPITPALAAAFKEVRLRALLDTPTAFGSTHAKEAAMTDDDWQTRAIQWNGERSVGFLALDGQMTCGIIGGFLNKDDATIAHVISMWVAPTHRRSGVGRQLVMAVSDWARSKQARRLNLMVTSCNTAAMAFYDRVGFARTGRIEPYPNDPALVEYELSRALS
jgi:ribosomal protein S18 acetylase RimI-like enzyme/adenylate kinase family enzyme